MNARNRKRPRARPADPSVPKSPDDWVTANEPMTAAQASYLKTLCSHAGEAFVAHLTKAEASKRIDSLRNHWFRRAG
ncbi:MAG TPA: DUF3072 domain-containing protein [Polyangiaceae bacterium]|jgi:hypothetical protein|nr:DUF3072 domain-containing protein [Polyangiaceae bacterium]